MAIIIIINNESKKMAKERKKKISARMKISAVVMSAMKMWQHNGNNENDQQRSWRGGIGKIAEMKESRKISMK